MADQDLDERLIRLAGKLLDHTSAVIVEQDMSAAAVLVSGLDWPQATGAELTGAASLVIAAAVEIITAQTGEPVEVVITGLRGAVETLVGLGRPP